MLVKVGFKFGRYTVEESCTLLSVTLVVKGEVIRPFTVSVMPIGFYVPSARGKCKSFIATTICYTVIFITTYYNAVDMVFCLGKGASVIVLIFKFTLAGRDFVSDALEINFQPGQSRSSICIVIIDDDIREGSEKFRLLLSIPYSVRALGVWAQHPYYANVLIIGKLN